MPDLANQNDHLKGFSRPELERGREKRERGGGGGGGEREMWIYDLSTYLSFLSVGCLFHLSFQPSMIVSQSSPFSLENANYALNFNEKGLLQVKRKGIYRAIVLISLEESHFQVFILFVFL